MLRVLLLFSVLVYNNLNAQIWELERTISIENEITSVSYDNQQNFYVGTKIGQLIKYSSSGEKLSELSIPNSNEITLIEARNPLRVFTFSKENQEFTYIERFISNPTIYSISKYSTSFASLSTPGIDNSFWIHEVPQNILTKYNESSSRKMVSIILANQMSINKISYFTAFRDLLILSDEVKGIFIFDQFGNFINSINIEGVSYFQVLGDQIITLSNNNILIIDLYGNKVIETKKSPGKYKSVIYTGSLYFFFKKNIIDIYKPL